MFIRIFYDSLPDGFHVVIPDPLVPLVCVGSHPALRVLDDGPAAALDPTADLVVGQEPGGARELSGLTLGAGRGVEPVVGGFVQGEGLPVQGHTQHQLIRRGTGLDPVVDRVVLKKKISDCAKQTNLFKFKLFCLSNFQRNKKKKKT